ncbi:MAG: sigma-70 family RNA polymerase sigma factor [Chitinophagaceae bacterium]
MNLKTTYSEQELVALLKERNEQAFGYLYDNYSGALLGIVGAIITDREAANDVLQNVFVNIWRRIDSYDPSKGRLFTWMLNIARNAAIDELRSKGYRDTQKNFPITGNEELPGAAAGPAVVDVGLKKVLAMLKEEWRTLIDLSYFQGFTHEEIARMVGLPLGTVKTRIRSALIQLRSLIK